MNKFKVKLSAFQMSAFQQLLEHVLLDWDYTVEEWIFKYALIECLTTVKKKLAIPELKKDFKLTFSPVQAQAIYWLWQEMGDQATNDFSNKLHMTALEIHQQFS